MPITSKQPTALMLLLRAVLGTFELPERRAPAYHCMGTFASVFQQLILTRVYRPLPEALQHVGLAAVGSGLGASQSPVASAGSYFPPGMLLHVLITVSLTAPLLLYAFGLSRRAAAADATVHDRWPAAVARQRPSHSQS